MIIWLDAHLSPAIAEWISLQFAVPAIALRDLGLTTSTDRELLNAARLANAIVITKDADIAARADQIGTAPKLIWLSCRNTSVARLKEILIRSLDKSLELLDAGEQFIEVRSDD
jgi:predicted nuclease of predicted toxin-antitoxin system